MSVSRVHAKGIPSQCHYIYPVVELIEDQRSRSTRSIAQVNPYHLRIQGISREPDRCEYKGDPDIAKENPPVMGNLTRVAWFLDQGHRCLNGQEKEDT